jgi:hypothetical protein
MSTYEARNLYARAAHDGEGASEIYDDKPLVILRVEDKYQIVHILKIYRQDDPATVAQSFGLTHGLDQTAVSGLAKSINGALDAAKKTERSLVDVRPPSNINKASLWRSAVDAQGDAINNGEQKYIVGKRRTEVEM